MVPKICDATMNAALDAAAPPTEHIRYAIYCRFAPDSLHLTPERQQSFVGVTEHGTLVAVRFSPDAKPEVTVISLLALKKARIIGAFGRYLIHISFFVGHLQQEFTILASGSSFRDALPRQTEQLEGFVQTLRKLT